MSDMRPTVPGAVPSLDCSVLAWGGALASIVLLFMAGGASPDGTGGIVWLLLSAPLLLATVALWLAGFVVVANSVRMAKRPEHLRLAFCTNG